MTSNNSNTPPTVQSTSPVQPKIPTPVQPTPVAPVQTNPVSPVQPSPVKPVQPQAATPVTPPQGQVVPVAPCCPDVSTFEGSTGGTSTYFGFDDKTNSVVAPAKPYWDPATAAKTIKGKEHQDGARWVSVGVGRRAQVEINFLGSFTNPCLANCTYEIDPPAIADVVGAKPTATGAAFRIEGKAAGEASLKVMCDGKLRGFFHIWCVQPASITVDYLSVKSALAPTGGTISTATLQQHMNDTLGQAVIDFNVVDLGTVDLSQNQTFTTAEAAFYTQSVYSGSTASMIAIKAAADAAVAARPSSQPQFSASSIRLYYYVPGSIANGLLGKVIAIGQPDCFTFNNPASTTYNTCAHEIGHCLDLVHPGDKKTNGGASETAQYPAHHVSATSTASFAFPATNTEPAAPAVGAHIFITAEDPLNLMGYWPVRTQAVPIRYRQWKNCRRQP